MTMGHPDGLRFALRWHEDAFGTAADVTRGWLSASIGDHPVWNEVEWTWVELLEHLARNWRYLVWEQSFPVPMRPAAVEQVEAAAALRWHDMPPNEREAEEEALREWRESHDLSRALQGAIVSPLVIVREGLGAWLCGSGVAVRADLRLTRRCLEDLGASIAARLGCSRDDRAIMAREAWHARQDVAGEDQL